jgi:hypothetical protein
MILVHDANKVQTAVYDLCLQEKDVWVLDIETFNKHFSKLFNSEAIDKNNLICRGTDKSPLKRSTSRDIVIDFDFSDKNMQIADLLDREAHDPELLYIRDIRPEDIILLLDVAVKYQDEYMGRNGFIDILLKERKYLFQLHDWQDISMQNVINREFWFRPIAHMGLINGNYKITAVGEYLQKLGASGSKNEYKDLLTYRFLKAPGIETFLKTASKIKCFSKGDFDRQLCTALLKRGFFKNEEAGIRYVRSIFSWMKQLRIAEWESIRFNINKKYISDLLRTYESSEPHSSSSTV